MECIYLLKPAAHRGVGKGRDKRHNHVELNGDMRGQNSALQPRHQAELSLIITSWTHVPKRVCIQLV